MNKFRLENKDDDFNFYHMRDNQKLDIPFNPFPNYTFMSMQGFRFEIIFECAPSSTQDHFALKIEPHYETEMIY